MFCSNKKKPNFNSSDLKLYTYYNDGTSSQWVSLSVAGAAGVAGADGGGEGMIGTISRVTTFNSALSDSDILSHSNAWSIPDPSSLLFSGLAALALLGRRR